MLVHLSFSNLTETRWYEYLIRFTLGGIATVITGVIGSQFGPVIGGLFLAVPSILYASATLIRKHAAKRKKEHGLPIGKRADYAVALDTVGTTLSGVGLTIFALVTWRLLQAWGLVETLALATTAWIIVSLMMWMMWRFIRNSLRPQAR